jgi:AbrB family transcriptional regulator (stage V sporulation protein T)
VTPERRIFLTDENRNYYVSCAMPIFTEGDVVGCVVSVGSTEGKYELPATETEIKLVQTAASFLGRQMES